jgi:hypothetical protein
MEEATSTVAATAALVTTSAEAPTATLASAATKKTDEGGCKRQRETLEQANILEEQQDGEIVTVTQVVATATANFEEDDEAVRTSMAAAAITVTSQRIQHNFNKSGKRMRKDGKCIGDGRPYYNSQPSMFGYEEIPPDDHYFNVIDSADLHRNLRKALRKVEGASADEDEGCAFCQSSKMQGFGHVWSRDKQKNIHLWLIDICARCNAKHGPMEFKENSLLAFKVNYPYVIYRDLLLPAIRLIDTNLIDDWLRLKLLKDFLEKNDLIADGVSVTLDSIDSDED